MTTKSTLIKLWEEQKPKIVFVSVLIPIIIVILSFFFKDQKAEFDDLKFALLIYQIGFLIGVVYETQKTIAQRKTKRITKIQLNTDFWDGNGKYKTLYINALNGERFFEMISNHNILVDKVSVISPSLQAIEAYYNDDKVVNNKQNAINIMNNSISSIENNVQELLRTHIIKEVEVKRLGTFPLDFYAVFDGKKCLVGKYLKDPLRKNTIGLKSLSWVEDDIQLVSYYAQHFEELWSSL